MHKYEAMFIVRPNLSEEEKKGLFSQIGDVITKNNGAVSKGNIWSERKKLCFPIKKSDEGIYYLVNFSLPQEAMAKIRQAYKLNENILRVLITVVK